MVSENPPDTSFLPFKKIIETHNLIEFHSLPLDMDEQTLVNCEMS